MIALPPGTHAPRWSATRLAACLLAAIACLCLVPPAAADQSTKYRIEVNKFKDPATRRAMLEMAMEVEEEIIRVTNSRETSLTIEIVPGNSIVYRPGQMISIGWPKNSPPHHFLPRLTNYLLLRRLTQHFPDRQPRLRHVPSWIIAGVCHRVLDKRTHLIPNSFYPAVHAAVINNDLPTLQDVFNRPPGPDDGPVYYIYAEYCAVLIRALEKESQSSIDNILAHTRPDRTNYAALLSSLPEVAHAESPSAWYQRRLEMAGVWSLYPASYSYAAKELEDIQNITVMTAGDGDFAETRTIDLMELDYDTFAYFHQSRAFANFVQNIRRMQLSGPVLLRQPIGHFILAIQEFENGRQDRFLYLLLEARKYIDRVVDVGEAIERYLDRMETGHRHSLLPRYALYHQLIFHDLQPTHYELQVSDLLDKLEDE